MAYRTPATLLTAAGRGDRVASLSAEEQEHLLAHASKVQRRFLNEICNRLQANDLRAARHKAHKMLGSPSVRLFALTMAERRRTETSRRPLEVLLARIAEVDVFRRTASPRLTWQSKAEGGNRPICKFGPEDHACSKLVSMVLQEFARVHPRLACHPSQTILFGGSPTACERLREALLHAPEGAVFVQLDIKGFFQAINVAHLAQITGLPPVVIHRHLSCDHMRLRQDGEGRSSLSRGHTLGHWPSAPLGDGCDEEEAVPGISQGSAASAAAAEMVMGAVLRDVGALEPFLLLITYSDNIGVLVSSRERALAVTEALQLALLRHKAGPFHIHRPSIREVTKGFTFLGYQWRKTPRDRVSISPGPGRFARWKIEFWNRVGDAGMSPDPSDLLDLRSVIRGYAGSKRLWPGADRFRRQTETKLLNHFIARCEMLAVDPYSLVPERDHRLLDEAKAWAGESAEWRERDRNTSPPWTPPRRTADPQAASATERAFGMCR